MAALPKPAAAVTSGIILMMRSLLLGVLCATTVLAFGNAHAEGDKAAGKTLVYTCAGCHGVPGYQNAYPNYHVPRIAGQNEQYIINALHSYKKGDRKHPTMDAQAESLSDQDIANIAAYLSSLAK
jgi:cytochrome c553